MGSARPSPESRLPEVVCMVVCTTPENGENRPS